MRSYKQILYWLLVIFTVYLIADLLRHLLGGSLGFEELLTGLMIANLGYSFYINSKLSEHVGWCRGRTCK